ncbi:sacsin isoform X1 [Cucumis melo var. makuwa]|uniref:Sacsin isoform X1 n=1 Tax=Cucumis melo var. makuwa TaxID=1194695 RepID=A0A5D3C5D3_CUCMM|nr:sacsin isoform X1 [Cucumis melo var. makuwa]
MYVYRVHSLSSSDIEICRYTILFGEFQGPALVAIFEGSSLSTEEISSLQFRPPWKLRGDTLNYGLGLLSCYYVCDLLSIISGGYFYIFDPRGIALSVAAKSAPGAKVFSLIA